MAHRVQYTKDIRLSQNDEVELAYYKAQIQKVRRQKNQIQSQYQAKILSLTRRLKFGKKKIFFNQKTNYQSAKEELERYNDQIKSLKQKIAKQQKYQKQLQNSRIYPDPMSKIIELTHEIMKLKKSLNEIKSKYDGNNYTEHRIKTSYESLRSQNQQLRQKIRQIQKQKQQIKRRDDVANYDELETVKQKNKYEILKKQNDKVENYVFNKQQNLNKQNGVYKQQGQERQLQSKLEKIQKLKYKNLLLNQKAQKLEQTLQFFEQNKENEKLQKQFDSTYARKSLDRTFA